MARRPGARALAYTGAVMRIPTATRAPGLRAGILVAACLAAAPARAVQPASADVAAPAPADVTAPAPADVEARRAAALRLHEERRHDEAAALLERLSAETGRTDLLFDAGQARFAAGHRAHALRLWQAFADAPGRGADDLALATRRIADARALTTPVEVRVLLPPGASATATVHRRYDPPDHPRPPIVLSDMRMETGPSGHVLTTSVALDPGVWELIVAAPGRPEARRELHVDRAAQAVEVSLLPIDPPDMPTRRVRTGLSIGLLTAGTLAAMPGGVLAGWRARQLGAVEASCRAYGPEAVLCTEGAVLGRVREAGLGSGFAGAGAGLLVAGITAAFPARRRVWIAELAVGGAALLVGAVWLGANTARYAPDEFDAYLEQLQPWFRRRAVAAALLGAGLGLSTGATSGLLVWRRRPVQLRPALAPTGVGLVARF